MGERHDPRRSHFGRRSDVRDSIPRAGLSRNIASRPGLLFAIVAFAASPAFGQAIDKSAYSFANPTPREALREISTDRPDKTESPYTVDAGRVQVELDFAAYTLDRDRQSRTEMVGVLPINLKLGLTNSTDLQLLVYPHVRQKITNRATGVRHAVSGFGDVTLRLKHNLWGNDGGRTCPCADARHQAACQQQRPRQRRRRAWIDRSARHHRFRFGRDRPDDRGRPGRRSGYAANFINSAAVGFDLTSRVGAYTELFVERSTDRGARWIVTGDVGLTYALSDDLQLDGGVNIGITDAADDIQLFVGVSRRF